MKRRLAENLSCLSDISRIVFEAKSRVCEGDNSFSYDFNRASLCLLNFMATLNYLNLKCLW